MSDNDQRQAKLHTSRRIISEETDQNNRSGLIHKTVLRARIEFTEYGYTADVTEKSNYQRLSAHLTEQVTSLSLSSD